MPYDASVVALERPGLEYISSSVSFLFKAGLEAFLDRLFMEVFEERFRKEVFDVVDRDIDGRSDLKFGCAGADLLEVRGDMLRSSALMLKVSKGMVMNWERSELA